MKTEAKKLARETGPIARKRKKKSSVADERKVKRKVGRPKATPQIPIGVQTIASFFRKL